MPARPVLLAPALAVATTVATFGLAASATTGGAAPAPMTPAPGLAQRLEPANPGPQSTDAAAALRDRPADTHSLPDHGRPDHGIWTSRELALSPDQKGAIVQELTGGGSKLQPGDATTGSDAPAASIMTGQSLPLAIHLREFPPSLTTRMPELAGLRYVKLLDRILIVDPAEHVVVSEISM